ncbi:dual specificity protein kinase pyk3-like isoform X3 [Drosophila nasuta]|uniref:dual specificity protein kinase pyk3-like isoform X3 n=1 Tax=Drosophila nasuta TaxID=42062 RepID=UPI00295E4088|nr:dual specificity protein kinase pyk3-like isoform X3 [Drosophila nasuta]
MDNVSNIKLGKRIGCGSYGVVHKAIWQANDQLKKIAVKIIQENNEDSETEIINKKKNILNEIRNLQQFNHRNIVTLYGAAKDPDNTIYMIFELADCGSLYNFLHCSANDVSYVDKINWMAQCAKGIDYLHSNNTIHRDLKTQNLLLFDKYRRLKIGDFGTVKQLTTINTEFIGTIRYMAPELVIANGKYTEKCDVFSFGIIFWEVMSRKKPFENLKDMHPLAIQKKILEGLRPNIYDAITYEGSDCFKRTIEECWAEDPGIRPSIKELIGVFKINRIVYCNVNYDDIELGKMVASGKYNEVYKATWYTEGQYKDVAAHINRSCIPDFKYEQSTLSIIYYLKNLKHENIATLYDVSKTHDNRICLLFELADCGSLHNCLHHTEIKISYIVKLNWMLQFVKGMEHLLSIGISHRDLKSKNLMLFDEYRTLKIGEFIAVKPLHLSDTFIGPVHYTAPEVYETHEHTEKSDVFSFGIIFWEVMCRRKPFHDINPSDISKFIISGGRPNVDALPIYEDSDHIKYIINKCFARYPENRPTINKLSVQLHFDPKVFTIFPDLVNRIEPLANICDADFSLQ